jgi:hypothetical protein
MKRFMKYYREKKGITLVLIALMLAVLLFFLGMAVDISYMYHVKNQLQVAADAAALAGASNLDGTNSITQEPARREAWKFACKNRATDRPVFLVTDDGRCPLGSPCVSPACDSPPASGLNETNNDTIDDDIVVGYWDGSSFNPSIPAGQIANAVRTRARKIAGSPNGAAQVFVGQIFRILGPGPGWSFMNARASAIASRPPVVEASIVICLDSCNPGVISPSGTLLYWAPYPAEVTPGNVGIAWTSFNTSSQASDPSTTISYFCGATSKACGLSIYTSNGAVNSLARQFRCAFKNPMFDSSNKTCADGACDSASDTVTSWAVIVPIVSSPNGCPPGDQPAPDLVVSYGRLTITEVYASGGGGTSNCACAAYDAPPMTGPTPNAIMVNSLECATCPATEFFGRLPALVK